jgi:nucleoside-diphosphate-sugar epimerase
MTERLCTHYREDYGLDTRIVRFHNIYGPQGTYDGGREKAPAALCRKVAQSDDTIEVWGDGLQTRSFCHIDDCLEGLHRIMESDWHDPINLGRDRMVTINQLAEIIMEIAGKQLKIKHVEGPQGVRGRNSDNTLAKEVLKWEPSIPLEEGLKPTYEWIREQLAKR